MAGFSIIVQFIPIWVAVSGLFVISVCYIGVNLLGIGLHSYGWFFDS